MRLTTGDSSEPRSGCGSTDAKGSAPGHRLPGGRWARAPGLVLGGVLAGTLLGTPGAVARPAPAGPGMVIRLPARVALPAHPAPWIRRLGHLLGIHEEIPVPVALEILKGAFDKPWSSNPRKRNQLVCHFLPTTGSHITNGLPLHCTTNAHHLDVMSKRPWPLRSGLVLDISHRALRKIFGELPSPRGVLEFDLVAGGRVLSRWTLRNGEPVRMAGPGRTGKRRKPAGRDQRSIDFMSSGR